VVDVWSGVRVHHAAAGVSGAWTLDPDIAYLNHGGFGATPVSVLADQQAWRAAMERNPTDFLVRRLPDLLATVRARIAAFLGAPEDGLVFVRLPAVLDEPAARALEDGLLAGHGVVVPVTCYDGWQWVRVSAQLYNTLADYERLAAALGQLFRG
jgi:selenocysteine lyase/cysteine desulfurase